MGLRGPKGTLDAQAGTKVCSRCKETLALSEFNRYKHRYQAYCRSCTREVQKDYYDRVRRHTIRESKYGISEEDFNAAFQRQEGMCAICSAPLDESANADHNHVTGEFRGLLCRECNLLLGYAHDDPDVLLTAIVYLRGGN